PPAKSAGRVGHPIHLTFGFRNLNLEGTPSLSRVFVRQGGDFDFHEPGAQSPSALVSLQSALTRSPPLPQLRSRSGENYSISSLPDVRPVLFAPDSDECIATSPPASPLPHTLNS